MITDDGIEWGDGRYPPPHGHDHERNHSAGVDLFNWLDHCEQSGDKRCFHAIAGEFVNSFARGAYYHGYGDALTPSLN